MTRHQHHNSSTLFIATILGFRVQTNEKIQYFDKNVNLIHIMDKKNIQI